MWGAEEPQPGLQAAARWCWRMSGTFFVLGLSGASALAIRGPPHPLQMSFTFFSSLILEGKREGRKVSRKEGGKKWKHLSRRAEAIRNACWVSKTENREKGIKIKSSVKRKRWGWKGLCYFVKRRTRPKHNTVPGSIQTRQSKYNHLMKKRQGGVNGWWKECSRQLSMKLYIWNYEDEEKALCMDCFYNWAASVIWWLDTDLKRLSRHCQTWSHICGRKRHTKKSRGKETEKPIHFLLH